MRGNLATAATPVRTRRKSIGRMRRPRVVIMVVIALTLGLLPSTAALGALPTDSDFEPIGVAAAGMGQGNTWHYWDEESGLCDELTPDGRVPDDWWHVGHGFHNGGYDYLVGIITGYNSHVLHFCIEIEPVDALAQEPGARWAGTGGVGVIDYWACLSCPPPASVGGSGRTVLTSLTLEQPDTLVMAEWHVTGRFHDADNPAITGDFIAECSYLWCDASAKHRNVVMTHLLVRDAA